MSTFSTSLLFSFCVSNGLFFNISMLNSFNQHHLSLSPIVFLCCSFRIFFWSRTCVCVCAVSMICNFRSIEWNRMVCSHEVNYTENDTRDFHSVQFPKSSPEPDYNQLVCITQFKLIFPLILFLFSITSTWSGAVIVGLFVCVCVWLLPIINPTIRIKCYFPYFFSVFFLFCLVS